MTLINLAFLAAEGESLGETMARAGLNTAMGIGIVFFALAFISIVIALQGKIFQAIAKKKAAPKVVEAPKTEVVETEAEEDLSNDEELVAVIAAAVAASENISPDGFVVRSIRKANRRAR